MGTKANPAPCDCYANAAPDEPLFVLLARDKHAPALVWLWAAMREIDGEPEDVIREARECALAMAQYRAETLQKGGAVGFGLPLLAGLMELVRAANTAVRDPQNTATGIDAFRLYAASVSGFGDRSAKLDNAIEEIGSCA